MKNYLFKGALVLLSSMFVTFNLTAQAFDPGVRRAEKLTEKGFADKKSTFDPAALDSLLKCDDYVMLISSFEGCGPCEWLRTSDVFDLYPVTPYYTDFLLNKENETVPYTFSVTGFPTCMFFNRSGEIVAVTSGTAKYYDKLDRIINNKENLCESEIGGLEKDRILQLFNRMHKANTAYMRGDWEGVREYATAAMEIYPYFYNRYLLYKYYENGGDKASADRYKALALDNADERDGFVYKKLIAELKGE